MQKHSPQQRHCDSRSASRFFGLWPQNDKTTCHPERAVGESKDLLEGFTTLVAVLIVGAVATAAVVSMLVSGVGSLQSSLAIQRSGLARHYADTCAEEALHQLSEDTSYAAGATLVFDYGNCAVNAISGSGATNRVIQVTGAVDTVARRVEVDVSDLSGPVILNSWQEVASF